MSDRLSSVERDAVATLLACRIGLEFEEYRFHMLDSAVRRHMKGCNVQSFSEYSDMVSGNEHEFGNLVDLVTNNLSRFCRNAGQLQAIQKLIVPGLNGHARSGCPLNVWIAGCATGEEPYSVAITLAETLGGVENFRITATDVSRGALETARRGVYSSPEIRAVPQMLRPRYFVELEEGWQVGRPLRDRVEFLEHNVVAGAAIQPAEIVFCRNVLIYLTPSARRRAIDSLADALVDDGYLLVGNSETLPRDSRFTSVSTRWGRVYRRSCRGEG